MLQRHPLYRARRSSGCNRYPNTFHETLPLNRNSLVVIKRRLPDYYLYSLSYFLPSTHKLDPFSSVQLVNLAYVQRRIQHSKRVTDAILLQASLQHN